MASGYITWLYERTHKWLFLIDVDSLGLVTSGLVKRLLNGEINTYQDNVSVLAFYSYSLSPTKGAFTVCEGCKRKEQVYLPAIPSSGAFKYVEITPPSSTKTSLALAASFTVREAAKNATVGLVIVSGDNEGTDSLIYQLSQTATLISQRPQPLEFYHLRPDQNDFLLPLSLHKINESMIDYHSDYPIERWHPPDTTQTRNNRNKKDNNVNKAADEVLRWLKTKREDELPLKLKALRKMIRQKCRVKIEGITPAEVMHALKEDNLIALCNDCGLFSFSPSLYAARKQQQPQKNKNKAAKAKAVKERKTKTNAKDKENEKETRNGKDKKKNNNKRMKGDVGKVVAKLVDKVRDPSWREVTRSEEQLWSFLEEIIAAEIYISVDPGLVLRQLADSRAIRLSGGDSIQEDSIFIGGFHDPDADVTVQYNWLSSSGMGGISAELFGQPTAVSYGITEEPIGTGLLTWEEPIGNNSYSFVSDESVDPFSKYETPLVFSLEGGNYGIPGEYGGVVGLGYGADESRERTKEETTENEERNAKSCDEEEVEGEDYGGMGGLFGDEKEEEKQEKESEEGEEDADMMTLFGNSSSDEEEPNYGLPVHVEERTQVAVDDDVAEPSSWCEGGVDSLVPNWDNWAEEEEEKENESENERERRKENENENESETGQEWDEEPTNEEPNEESVKIEEGQFSRADLLNNQSELEETNSFDDMGLKENVLRGIYSYGFEYPSAVQSKVIKPMIDRKDLVAITTAGMGKTAAYAIPVIQKVDIFMGSESGPQALVLVPTRPLANQVSRVISSLGDYANVSVATLVGGTSVRTCMNTLREGKHVIVGTPGRVLDMISRGALTVNNLKMLIFDEIDDLLSKPDALYDIITSIPLALIDTQICCFGSVVTPRTYSYFQRFLKPDYLRIFDANPLSPAISHFAVSVQSEFPGKFTILREIIEAAGTAGIAQGIIFVDSKRKADWLIHQFDLISSDWPQIKNMIGCVHEDLGYEESTRAIEAFVSGDTRFLVTTGSIALGMDFFVGLVVNYVAPASGNAYIQRAARCGRYGRKGGVVVTLFVSSSKKNLDVSSEDEKRKKKQLEKELVEAGTGITQLKDCNAMKKLFSSN